MRSVVLTATLFGALYLAAPGSAWAQDPPPPPPPPPAPRDVAVPRAERVRARDAEARVPQSAPETRSVERSQPSASQPAQDGGARRRPSTADEGRGRAPAPVAAASTVSANDEQGSDGGQRRGAVRRPPSGGSGGSTAGGQGGQGSGATRDRAVPRTSEPRQPQRVFIYPDYYRYYNRYYDPWGYGGFGLGYFYYSPWGWNPGYYSPSYGYGYGGGHGYYGGGSRGRGYDMGAVKLKVTPRDAEVYVDGYFAGEVDDFDGIWQALKLETGAYRLEIRKPGFETLHFDVRVQPERNITFRGEMKPTVP